MRLARSRILLGSFVLLGALALAGCGSAQPQAAVSALGRTPASASPGPAATPAVTPSLGATPHGFGDPNMPAASQRNAPPSAAITPGFDRGRLSIADPTSVWVVANKVRPLAPANFAPTDLVQTPVGHQNPPILRKVAADALVALFAAAKTEGAGTMQLQSAYRSFALQVKVYGGYVNSLGVAAADAQSARPGFSEHQTGLAADISASPANCTLAACFGGTPQGKWLAANSWRFGYLLRYPSDKTSVTGYIYEPWHFRYVGLELASEMHATGTSTLEEFFGLPAAPDYPR